MERLIFPGHIADFKYIIPAIQVYAEDGGWVSTADYIDREFRILRANGVETEMKPDRTDYTKDAELSRYFGFIERQIPGDIKSDCKITDLGLQFYNAYLNEDSSEMHEALMKSFETITFGRNNDGCPNSNTRLEAPNILLIASLMLDGVTRQEYAAILYDMVNYNAPIVNAIVRVKLRRGKPGQSFNTVRVDNKVVPFLVNSGFLEDNNGMIQLNHFVKECYQERISKLRTTNDEINIFPEHNMNNSNDSFNMIFFGAPGTGKSYKIEHDVIPSGMVPYRVTFYPDYYYSDFVGGLRPYNGDNGLEYKFEPGPFAKALKDSFTKKTYLVIEEINRGNAAAIFGDIFQLLDRKTGDSEYSVTNHDLYQYLVDNGVDGLEKDKIYIPDGLVILCTMNTADQNVFVLDTAFKRRFRMEYVPIDFNSYYKDGIIQESCKCYLENTDIFKGDSDLKEILGTDLFSKVEKAISTSPSRNWPSFAAFVNAKIDSINAIEQKISEDKKLGPFFVSGYELKDRKAFADKVLYYLKQDVFKYEDNILDESYETIYDRFVNNKDDIFTIFDLHR